MPEFIKTEGKIRTGVGDFKGRIGGRIEGDPVVYGLHASELNKKFEKGRNEHYKNRSARSANAGEIKKVQDHIADKYKDLMGGGTYHIPNPENIKVIEHEDGSITVGVTVENRNHGPQFEDKVGTIKRIEHEIKFDNPETMNELTSILHDHPDFVNESLNHGHAGEWIGKAVTEEMDITDLPELPKDHELADFFGRHLQTRNKDYGMGAILEENKRETGAILEEKRNPREDGAREFDRPPGGVISEKITPEQRGWLEMYDGTLKNDSTHLNENQKQILRDAIERIKMAENPTEEQKDVFLKAVETSPFRKEYSMGLRTMNEKKEEMGRKMNEELWGKATDKQKGEILEFGGVLEHMSSHLDESDKQKLENAITTLKSGNDSTEEQKETLLKVKRTFPRE